MLASPSTFASSTSRPWAYRDMRASEESFGSRRASTARRPPSAERVAAVLRSAVRDGSLKGGAQVNQQRWADRLGVSRAALREGLKLLAAEKLLRHEGHRGYFVSAVDLAAVEEIYWLRIQVEREVFLSCHMPDGQTAARLTATCHAALTAADNGDRPARFAAERQFFFELYLLSPLRFLRDEAMRMWDLAETCRSMVEILPPAGGPSFGNLKERRLLQLDAAISGDRWTLTESVLGERRRMVACLSTTADEGGSGRSLRWA